MATSGASAGAFSGRSQFNLRVSVSRTGVSGTTSTWTVYLDVMNPTGSSISFYLNNVTATVNVNGHVWNGTRNLDFRSGQSFLRFVGPVTFQVAQGAGTPTIQWSASLSNASLFGSASTSGSFTADRLATAPAAPTIRSITNVTQSAATVNWSAGSNNGASVTSTQIQVSTTSDFAGTTTRTATSTAFVFTGLNAGSRYYFRARQQNAAGWGSWSSYTSIVTASVPSAPTGLTASQITPTGWRVAHTPGANNGLAITGTQFQRSYNASFDGTLTLSTGTTPSGTFTGQSPGVTYYVRSRNQNAAGWGAWSQTITVTTPQLVVNYRGVNVRATGPAYAGLFDAMPAAGTPVTFSLDVRTIAGGAGEYGLAAYLSGEGQPFALGEEQAIAVGETRRLAVTFDSPGAGNLDGIVVYLNATDAAFYATTFAIANLLLETGEDELDYFDGDTPPIWGLPDPDPGQTEPLPGEEQGGIVIRAAQSPNATRIEACQPLLDPVKFKRNVGDIVTRVTVRWQDYAIDPETGDPGLTERSYTLVDEEAEAIHGSRGLSIGTLLPDQASAAVLAERILARVQGVHWRIEGLALDDAVAGTFDDDDDDAGRLRLLALLDGAERGGMPLYLADLPDWAPTGPDLPIFLEGGHYEYAAGAWRLDLAVSSATGQGQSGAYWDLDPGWRIWDVDPGVHTIDLRGVAGAAAVMPRDADPAPSPLIDPTEEINAYA